MVRGSVPSCLQPAVQLQDVFLKKQLSLIKFNGLALLMNTVELLSPRARSSRRKKKKKKLFAAQNAAFFLLVEGLQHSEPQLIFIRQVFHGVCSSSQLSAPGMQQGQSFPKWGSEWLQSSLSMKTNKNETCPRGWRGQVDHPLNWSNPGTAKTVPYAPETPLGGENWILIGCCVISSAKKG